MKEQGFSFKRVIYKLSGELLAGEYHSGLDLAVVDRFAREIGESYDCGLEIAIVVGGGNFMRGARGKGKQLERIVADQIGMLGTVINSLALQDALERRHYSTRVLSAVPIETVCEKYIRRRAIRHLEKGLIVILAAGTGLPFFSTDTAAVLRAGEIDADVILKGTNVDGVYSNDPEIDPDATLFDKMTCKELLNGGLGIIDSTAAALIVDRRLPLIVFNATKPGNLLRVLKGEQVGTFVEGT